MMIWKHLSLEAIIDYNFKSSLFSIMSFLGDAVVKNQAASSGDVGSIPVSGRSPGVGKGNPLQYSCLENSLDRGICQVTVRGVTQSQTGLSN